VNRAQGNVLDVAMVRQQLVNFYTQRFPDRLDKVRIYTMLCTVLFAIVYIHSPLHSHALLCVLAGR
jgi:hypothetical protein